ncbi:trehalose synthase [Sulfurifustis variabilis]|uniref:Trehalose synthase n=1 Tax=Sulfurifustis variabilis TaxID=1675686 RepID=A0A1B4V4Q2_9GAMM|nr:trehalose synthase [Sulfurifustis variabilis]
MSIEDLWYKNAVVYCLDVEKYMDATGDGVGDFEGLSRRLDYLAGIGVTCVWLQPFYPSPNRDNGYDVTDYYGVHPKHGSSGEFVEFMNHARAVGVRVIVDLVVNHTSNEHPWFRSARNDPASPYRDWYVWSRERPADHDTGMVFPGVQQTTWTWDEAARAHYFHRFYEFQPDLDTHRPAVRDEIRRIMGYWLELGVSGFRMDAVPFLIERKGADVEPFQDFDLLHEMRDFLQWRRRYAILLAEANVPPDHSLRYFGEQGDRLQMMLNFPVNQRLFYALASGDVGPLAWALEQTAKRPAIAQWVQFLRSHDELDLGRLTEEERERVFRAFGPEERMQIYHRGIRRRLAPMLGDDRRRLELAFSLLFSLPGAPMLQYGDEIGMGDDLDLPEREAARTPMQWTAERHGGFSRAEEIVRPAIDDPVYGYRVRNVADQRRDPGSLLNHVERVIRMRRECREISWGQFRIVRTNARDVLVLRYDWRDTTLVTLHNFSDAARRVHLNVDSPRGGLLVDVFAQRESRADASGEHRIELGPYGYEWFRVGSADNTLDRAMY